MRFDKELLLEYNSKKIIETKSEVELKHEELREQDSVTEDDERISSSCTSELYRQSNLKETVI